MTLIARFLATIPLVLCASLAVAEPRGLTIGLAIPESGAFAPLGDQVRQAFAVWQDANDVQFADVVEGEDRCDEASGVESADSFIEAGVDLVVGYLCAETLAAALPPLSDAGIPVLSLSVRADIFAEEAARNGWLFYRLAPRASDEANVAADAITALWADQPFALIEDGTISGRELTEAVRARLEELGLKPSFIDNYRPGQERQAALVRRLEAAKVSRVFVGGERRDIAIIARDAKEAGLDLRFMGGDQLYAAKGDIPLADGTLAIIAADSLPGAASGEAEAAFSTRKLPVEGLRLPAYAAAGILGAIQTRLGFTDETVESLLKSTTFQTAIGPVSFTADGERKEPGFSLTVWANGAFERISPAQVKAQEAVQ